jgi:cytochrome c oxidase assembly factor CtaG
VLGIVLAISAPLEADYYAARGWGPSLQMDQVVGAGILWILGDVLGVPFVMAVMRSLRAEERKVEAATDGALDQLETDRAGGFEEEPQAASGLWWENDPQFRDRFKR